MCILIVMRGLPGDHPVIVAGNRDERTDRLASPPGLWVGERRRVLSPRDRQAGGTWLAVNDRLSFAGITNLAGVPALPGAPSRGHLVHIVLDHTDLDAGIAAVQRQLAAVPHSAFQLLCGDQRRTVVLRHAAGVVTVREWTEPVLVITNQHEAGQLAPRGLAAATAPALDVDARLAALATVLRDRGGDGHHAICKRGDTYGTVSSSVVAIPRSDPTRLLWRYAPGPPDAVEYRNYGNLARRLLPEDDLL
jgi:uncharacterized protein with NRDE domain